MSTITAGAVETVRPNHGRRRIIGAVAAKEWLDIYRDARFRWLAALTLLMMTCALLFGVSQVERIDRDREVAAKGDREIWTSQGEKSPHAAAHFGQYAFKPQSPLALADPGIDSYAGTAVWLEAHKQNEVQFRPANDSGLSARLGNLSLAFVLQIVMPLLAILLGFAAFSGERERGTLRQLLSLGVRPVDLLVGKGLAIAGVLAALLVPAFAGIVICCVLFVESAAFSVVDQLVRTVWLALGYGFYLGGFVALALAVSAYSRSSRAALVGLLAFWLVNCFLMPRAMTDIVRASVALPTALEFRQAIADDKKKTFGHDESHPAFVAFRDRVLRQYGVTRVEDLPVDFRGLSLREDDENGYRIFDRRYGALQEAFAQQDRWRAAPGFLFPFLAIQPFSMGLAGSDTRSHYHFATAAEQHRRMIQTTISEDLIRNGRYGDPNYVAGHDLWARIPSFSYRAPSSSWALSAQAANVAALTVWLCAAVLLAWLAARRLRPF